MRKKMKIFLGGVMCAISLVSCGSISNHEEFTETVRVSSSPETSEENAFHSALSVKELFEFNRKGNALKVSDFQAFIPYAEKNGTKNELDFAVQYRNKEYELQVVYERDTETLIRTLLISCEDEKSIDIRKESVEEFLNQYMDMKHYITYDLPDSVQDNEFDPFMGNLGGNTFRSDKQEEKESDASIPHGWDALGGVEIYYKLNVTYENGIPKTISIPWNHSEFLEEPEIKIEGKVPAFLVPVSHSLATGNSSENLEEENRKYWYAFFTQEDSEISYAVYLSQDSFSKEEFIALVQSVQFYAGAFELEVE